MGVKLSVAAVPSLSICDHRSRRSAQTIYRSGVLGNNSENTRATAGRTLDHGRPQAGPTPRQAEQQVWPAIQLRMWIRPCAWRNSAGLTVEMSGPRPISVDAGKVVVDSPDADHGLMSQESRAVGNIDSCEFSIASSIIQAIVASPHGAQGRTLCHLILLGDLR